jgi:cytochrome c biogenesis protein CcdA
MLPAYLSFFLGLEGREGPDARAGLSRAIAVGLAVSAGFAATIAVIGLVVRHLSTRVFDWSPWVSVVIGAALVVLGVALLAGYELKVSLPRLDRGGRGTGVGSMALYGVSYGIVSLGCTLPIFLGYAATTITSQNLASGIAVVLAYSAGFAVLLTGLTVALALAQASFVRGLRRLLPYVQRASGAVVALAGAYVAYYGWYESHRIGEPDPVVDRVTGWSADAQNWLADQGGTRVGLVLALVVAGAAIYVATGRRTARR